LRDLRCSFIRQNVLLTVWLVLLDILRSGLADIASQQAVAVLQLPQNDKVCPCIHS
jgi:hypothetical protein